MPPVGPSGGVAAAANKIVQVPVSSSTAREKFKKITVSATEGTKKISSDGFPSQDRQKTLQDLEEGQEGHRPRQMKEEDFDALEKQLNIIALGHNSENPSNI